MTLVLLCGFEGTQAQNQDELRMLCETCSAESMAWSIQMAARPKSSDSLRLARYAYHWILYYDVYTTLSASHYRNPQGSQELNNLYYYYNLDIKSNLTLGPARWDFYGFNDYGVRHFPDSLTIKTQDQLTWKNTLSCPLVGKKLFLSLSAATQTRLWNTYAYRTGSQGNSERYLYEGYMSPGTVLYSGGLTAEIPGGTVLQLGLGSSKVTRIRDQSIFDSRNETKIAGLEKGKGRLSEWGLSMTATIPTQKIGRVLRWECFAQGFIPSARWKDVKAYQIDVNNVLHLILLRYMRISLRTKFARQPELSPLSRWQNHLSLGFYLNNRI